MNTVFRYFNFLLVEWRILSFGISFLFISSFGRTFYIALFGGEIRSAFDLTPGEFSYVYSSATLTGVLLIPWLGKLIDKVNLRIYAISLIVVLLISSLSLSFASNAIVLFIALFGFRVTGGSIMNHTAVVTMARHFVQRRGMATAVCSLGTPLGELVMPIFAVFTMGILGWRETWAVSSLFLILICIPLIFWLLKPAEKKPVTHQDPEKSGASKRLRSRTRREVMLDPKFYALTPALILPTPLITALFFHQATIAESKGWSLEWVAACFVAYAIATVVAAFAVGPLIDRYNSRAILPWTVGPMILGLGILAYATSMLSTFLYLLCMGFTTGARQALTAAIWAETYGTRHLGSIRSVVHTITMLLSGLSPAVFGWLIDQGVSIFFTVQVSAILLLVCGFIAKLGISK